MLWTFLTLVATAVVVYSIITPQWLIGKPHVVDFPAENRHNDTAAYSNGHDESALTPTIGLFNKCTRLHKFGDFRSDSCAIYVTGFTQDSDDFSDFWKASLAFFAAAVLLLAITNFTAVFSLCIQAIFKKSIFTVSGLIQSIAGLFLVIAQILYPIGWGAGRVRNLCGDNAGPFLIDQCRLGWAFFGCMGGTLLVFLCALMSIQAETSTSSDKVESKVQEGKHLICTA